MSEKEKPEGYIFGRPTDYRPEYCQRVVGMGAQGMSRAEIAANLRCGKASIQRWEAAHEDFRAAMAYAKTLEQAWWEKEGRENLKAQHFQASMWSRSMGARFPDDWRETARRENTGPDGGPQELKHSGSVAVSEVIGRIARLSARAAEDGDPGQS